jgi:hypothetical protein
VTSLFDWILRFLGWLVRRPVLRIRVAEDNPDRHLGGLVFEVENASPTVTSLEPVIRSTFWFPEKGRYRRGQAVYDVREIDRELPPFKAKLLTASARQLPTMYGFSWFRVYEFKARRGPRARVRVRTAIMEPLGAARFLFELWRFRLTGKVDKATPVTLADMEAHRRSHGPH